ncbi:MAG: ABC transporter ATP-binding protein, partial [Sphingomonadales bacterium]|nr:ABC transporter ATP-binding protein [Sphingomonadales bacterium]
MLDSQAIAYDPDYEGPIVSVHGLRNAFGAQVVHDNLNLDVHRGEIIGVVGGSGTG